METKTMATIAGAAAAGGVLAFAGLSLANAATGSSAQAPAMGGPQMAAGQYGGMGRGPGGMHGTPVTGDTLTSITDAVLAQYPDATVDSAEEEGDGYEAHVTKADGTQVHVTLDAQFAITGEHTGPPMGGGMPGGPRGMHGTPVTGDTLTSITDAVLAQYPGATVDFAEEEGDGYEAHVTKADGTKVHVTLDAQFAITGEHTGPPMMGGKGPHGEKPLKGAKAKKVRAAALNRIDGGTVVRVEKDRGGAYEAHVLTTKGRPVVVEVNKRFQVTGVERMPAMARHMGPDSAQQGSGPGA